MSNGMLDLWQDNNLTSPQAQVEQHPQRSEIIHYLRGLNQWLESDIHDRRAEIQSMSAHLERTHNKVIPLLNQIVQAMDLRREGVPPEVVRSPSDDQWDAVSSHPSPHVAPIVSVVSIDRASTSALSSSVRDHPEFPFPQNPDSSQLSVKIGGPLLEPELDPQSLGKTVMTPSNVTEVENPKHVEMLGQTDAVHTQLGDLMKLFSEHRDEAARKRELSEERWTANEARWEDKHAKDTSTNTILERILANQADIMVKFATFKNEVLAEFRKNSASSADHGVPEAPSLHPGPCTPSRSSSSELMAHENLPITVPMSHSPSAAGGPPSPILTPSSPSHLGSSAPGTTSPRPPIIINIEQQPVPCTSVPMSTIEGLPEVIHHYRSSSSRSSSPTWVVDTQPIPPIPPMPCMTVTVPDVVHPPFRASSGMSHRTRSPSCRTRSTSSSPSFSPVPPGWPSQAIPLSVPPPILVPSPPLPEHTIVVQRSPSRSPVLAPQPVPTTMQAVVPVARTGSRSPPRTQPHHDPSRSSNDWHRPRSPYGSRRPRSPYDSRRPRSPYDRPHSPYYRSRSPFDAHRPRSPYDRWDRPRGQDRYDARCSRHDQYEDEWRRRPRFPPLQVGPRREHADCKDLSRRPSPENRGRRLPRESPLRDARERNRPHAELRQGYRPYPPYSPPRSPEYLERHRSPRRLPPQSPERDGGVRYGLPRHPHPTEYEEEGRDRSHRPPHSRNSPGPRGSRDSPEGYRLRPSYPYDEGNGRSPISHPSHPRTELRVITTGRPTTAVHFPEHEHEPEHGAVRISTPSEPEYEHTITPPRQRPHTLASQPPVHHIPHTVRTELTEGDGGKPHLQPVRYRSRSPVPSFAGSAVFHRTDMAGPEYAIPILPSHAGPAVRLRHGSPDLSERIRPRSPHSPKDGRTAELRGKFAHESPSILMQPVRVPLGPPAGIYRPQPEVVYPSITPPPALRVVPNSVTPREPCAVQIVPAWPGSRNSMPEDAEQERQSRFDERVGVLDRTIIDLQNGEEKREENYRTNEEERERVFLENERRRDVEAEQHREAVWKELEDRLAARFKSPPVATMSAGSESLTRIPLGGGFLQGNIPGSFELSSGPSNTLSTVVPQASDAASMPEAASRHTADIHKAIRLEREAAQAERERAQELERAARDQMREEHRAHIRALENELGAVRKELADEKVARTDEEAVRHERKRAEMLVQNDMMRNQLGDVIGLLLERQDLKGIRGDDNRRQGGPIGLRFGHVCLCVCVCCVFLVAVGS